MDSKLPPAIFVAGSLALDFLNTLARPVDEEVDWLGDGADLLSWMEQAGLLTADDIAVITSNMSTKELDRVCVKARNLREWLRGFIKEHMGRPLNTKILSQLDPLAEILAADEMFWSLTAGAFEAQESPPQKKSSPMFFLHRQRRWRKPESLLSPIAEEIAKFIGTADFRYVKGCLGHNCILFFLDQTRRHGRRWCSMAVCGNRAKQDAHLERMKTRKLSDQGTK